MVLLHRRKSVLVPKDREVGSNCRPAKEFRYAVMSRVGLWRSWRSLRWEWRVCGGSAGGRPRRTSCYNIEINMVEVVKVVLTTAI
jgi:hypothetical protein